ncbi:hypothetical protein [Phyllobacterium zundukense]|uniref:Uncharacterized protein n=1 Tax=Phyllobacterium zundukense TaxID=1867719 RepID=A0A2N9VS52_9HYPH|nr:hypothetical protein [Phyllobacterium zundukense]ATU92743.1 hypothetical protein BLM14_14720 [Phyllobacterium zundukense]PIO42320.1 hypothetical protein B5P45_25175 [Phyllobacterium zundukense]
MASKTQDVFINCPFDDAFLPSFHALVFGVLACGFRVRCAREMDDGGETRIDKLYRIIEQCRYGIHDLSRTELDPGNNLPRFNMPLELGLYMGAKRYGDDDQKLKRCLILDVEPYRYQQFISDLAGMDITPHAGDPRTMVARVRNWLVTVSRRKSIPSSEFVLGSYDRFVAGLEDIAQEANLVHDDLIYADYERLVLAWIRSGHGLIAPE